MWTPPENEDEAKERRREAVNKLYRDTGDEDLLALAQSAELGGAEWGDVADHALLNEMAALFDALEEGVDGGLISARKAMERAATAAATLMATGAMKANKKQRRK